MICEICKKRVATITIQTAINGKSRQIHICQECAKEKKNIFFPEPVIESLSQQANLPPFLDSLLKQFSQPSFDKVYDMFSEHANKAMYLAQEECRRLRHELIDSGHLLLGLIKQEGIVYKFLVTNGFNTVNIFSELETLLGRGALDSMYSGQIKLSPRAKKIVELGYNAAKEMKSDYVGPEHLFIGILRENEGIAYIHLNKIGININSFLDYLKNNMPEKDDPAKNIFAGLFGLPDMKTINDEKPDLFKQFGRDLTALAIENKLDPVIGRENVIKRVIRILSRRTKNNPVLIGDPGVGKTSVVEGLAQAIVNGEVPENLIDKRVIELQISSMIAGTRFRGDFEDRFKRLLEEVTKENSNIILFIDELHTIVGAGAVGEGSLDAANILKPALARGEIHCIGATTIEEYRKHIEKDAALERRFQKIDISEPTKEETIEILKGLRDKYEAFHIVDIDDIVIEYAVDLSSRYITDRFLPDKAIDIIDEAAALVKLVSISLPSHIKDAQKELLRISKEEAAAVKNQEYEKAAQYRDQIDELKETIKLEKEKWMAKKGKNIISITKKDIESVVSDWTKIPLTDLKDDELSKYLNMDLKLKDLVIGQEEAVDELTRVLKRARSGIKNPNRPIGSFIFSGPTGVGKTETAKQLAHYLLGDKDKLIRFDMSEYMEKFNISKLIGAPPGYVGYDDAGLLTERVRRNPYSIILFDEIEKAHPEIFNILLQILDDGTLSDSQGRKVDFRNTIIILTTNLGSDKVKNFGFNSMSNDDAYDRLKDKVNNEIKNNFKVEFINRLNGTIVFKNLSKSSLEKIFELQTKNIKERLKEKKLSLIISKNVKDKLIQDSNYEEFGARSLGRLIEKHIEDLIAHALLTNKFLSGTVLKVVLDKKGNYILKKSE